MRSSLLDILVDPVSKSALRLEERRAGADGQVIEGTLRSEDGNSYPITGGIPRFTRTEDAGQKQTEDSFGFKWRQRDSYESDEFKESYYRWMAGKYGFENIQEMRASFTRRRRILDAGSGAGFSSGGWLNESWREGSSAEWIGVDISEAIDVARERLGSFAGTNFVQADIMQLPFRHESFDAIFSEGVLHHTPSTEQALRSLVPLLAPGGELMFYIYRKKGAIREFTDDYIRDLISPLPPEQAWELLRPLTRLGQAFAELRAEIEVPDDIPYLGIKAGRYDVQRFIYWHFAKMYWNDKIPFETSHHINFDWYHPRYAHRQTAEEIRRWCDELRLSITHFDEQESGYTVRAIKN